MTHDASTYVIAPKVLGRELDGEMVLLDSDGGTYFSLNETGAAIWRELARGSAEEEVCRSVAEEFPDVSEQRVASDVRELIGQLLDAGLIQPKEP
jgi:Coenzyme PQQ synthesis protein D (PqqD)